MTLHNPKGTSAVPFERDAWAFLAAAGITDTRQQKAVVQLVRSLKNASLWSKMKAIYPFVGGTATTHKYNLKDPQDTNGAYRLSFVGGWTHSSNGALPNGTNAYANTFATDTSIGQNAHYSIYLRTNDTRNAVDFGAWNNAIGQYSYFLQFTASLNIRDYRYRDSGASIARVSSITRTDGYFVLSKNANNDRVGYRNGTSEVTNTTTMDSPNGDYLYISALKDAISQSLYSSRQVAFLTMGESLTSTQTASLNSIVQRYQTTLGRNV